MHGEEAEMTRSLLATTAGGGEAGSGEVANGEHSVAKGSRHNGAWERMMINVMRKRIDELADASTDGGGSP
jgi:hypothetical protein